MRERNWHSDGSGHLKESTFGHPFGFPGNERGGRKSHPPQLCHVMLAAGNNNERKNSKTDLRACTCGLGYENMHCMLQYVHGVLEKFQDWCHNRYGLYISNPNVNY